MECREFAQFENQAEELPADAEAEDVDAKSWVSVLTDGPGDPDSPGPAPLEAPLPAFAPTAHVPFASPNLTAPAGQPAPVPGSVLCRLHATDSARSGKL